MAHAKQYKTGFDLKRAKVRGRGLRGGRPWSLAAVRQACEVTQQQLAEAAHVDQPEVSRLERRDDWKMSTLRRYAEALGGRLECAIVFDDTGHRFVVEP